MIDTFLELYHFRYLHPGTVFPLFLDNIATYERMGNHMRWAAAKRCSPSWRDSPRRTGASATTPSCSIRCSPTPC